MTNTTVCANMFTEHDMGQLRIETHMIEQNLGRVRAYVSTLHL